MTTKEISTYPQLEIDLRKVRDNFASWVARAGKAKITAVVKANCYGLGLSEIAPVLAQAGCDTFWVAHASEGKNLRKILPDAIIYVLGGPGVDSVDEFKNSRLRPVINTINQLQLWLETPGAAVEPVAIHVETGLNRLALGEGDLPQLLEEWKAGRVKISIIMSHFACSDDFYSPKNMEQVEKFAEFKKLFPGVATSIEASYGFMLPNDKMRHDIVRMGRALYGIKAPNGGTEPVLKLSAPVLQVKQIDVGQTVGYSATWEAKVPSRIATISLGYADGIVRSLQGGGEVYIPYNGKTLAAPIVGRVSMDLINFDATNLPQDAIHEGDMVELINYEHDVDELAGRAGTIGYEIMSRLGSRFNRVYVK